LNMLFYLFYLLAYVEEWTTTMLPQWEVRDRHLTDERVSPDRPQDRAKPCAFLFGFGSRSGLKHRRFPAPA
jgi:hypothetical protein